MESPTSESKKPLEPDVEPGDPLKGWLIRYIQARLERGLNAIILILGAPGTGKSWTGLRIAERIQPDFPIRHAVFGVEPLYDLLDTPGELPPKSVVLYDETGVGSKARRAMSHINLLFSDFLESGRYRGLVLIMTVPHSALVDINARRLAHLIIETQDWTADHRVIAKPYFVFVDPKNDFVAFPHPRVWPENSKPVRITQIEIGPPSPALVEQYEAKKREWGAGQIKKGRASLKPKGCAFPGCPEPVPQGNLKFCALHAAMPQEQRNRGIREALSRLPMPSEKSE